MVVLGSLQRKRLVMKRASCSRANVQMHYSVMGLQLSPAHPCFFGTFFGIADYIKISSKKSGTPADRNTKNGNILLNSNCHYFYSPQIIGCTVDVQNPAAVDMVFVARPTGLLDSVHQQILKTIHLTAEHHYF